MQNTLKRCLKNADETQTLGKKVGALIVDRAIICLLGPLGAGKTCFVQGLGQALKINDLINSPTFTMLNEYHSGRLPLFHLDLYRLKDDPKTQAALGGDDLGLLQVELDEIMGAPGVIVIEWAEFIYKHLPQDYLLIEFDYADDGQARTAAMSAHGPNSLAIMNKLS